MANIDSADGLLLIWHQAITWTSLAKIFDAIWQHYTSMC